MQRVTHLKAEERKIFDVCFGEAEFSTPDHIIDVTITAMRAGGARYTNSAGILPLRQAMSGQLRADNGVDHEASQIVVTNGANQIIFECFVVTLETGEDVIVPAPYWISYRQNRPHALVQEVVDIAQSTLDFEPTFT
ncbi:MAG: aminotransferase class I/II-fold pyridoxal phosphate-dependent enzyme [Paracoccaceae bacterium]